MKNIHFFGCSFTAGDELADDEFTPWKKDCATAQEYYQRREELMVSGELKLSLYVEACKRMAYPAHLNSDSVTTYNHGAFGASIKECVLKIIKTVSIQSNINGIFLQLPPNPRELYLEPGGKITSIQISSLTSLPTKQLQRYVESKIVSHNFRQWTAEYLMDLILIHDFVKSKNIPFHVITLGSNFYHTQMNLWGSLQCLKKELQRLNLIDLDTTYPEFQSSILLGRHYSAPVHLKIAEVLKPIIDGLD